MISLDTETTGLDLYHGAKPYLVTICQDNGESVWWEWDVNPLTREPQIPQEDLDEIQHEIDSTDLVVMHNAKFDVAALRTIYGSGFTWDWSKTKDTLYSAHLLRSNELKDLTTLALRYLSVDLRPYEVAIQKATEKARGICRRKYPGWRISKKDLPEMPSAKEKVWKSDMWLPKALALVDESYAEEFYSTNFCEEYANSDSVATLELYKVHERLLKKQHLWKIYLERLKLLPIVYDMEAIGITANQSNLEELFKDYQEVADRCHRICVNVSGGGIEKLPVNGVSNALRSVVFDKFSLVSSKKTKKGNPSMDKDVLGTWMKELPTNSKPYTFIKNLKSYRQRKTALGYMESYSKFWQPVQDYDLDFAGWHRLHASFNPVGTKTLRWSSQNPNAENISKKEGFNLRYCFGPAPRREWWSLDYDNLELRIPAYECGEPAMLELFENPNEPPYFGSYHLLIFDILHPEMFAEYGADVKNVYKSTWYGWTKNGNFADMYGAMEASGTADRAFHVKGAQRIVSERLVEKSRLNQHWIDFAEDNGFVQTMPDAEICPDRGYPLVCPLTAYGRISPTIPLNYHVQGTACWVMMRAMIKIKEFLKDFPGFDMIMNVHDEVVLDFPYKPDMGNLPKIRKVKYLMESCGKPIGVPLTCGVDYHTKNWSTGVSV